MEKIFSVYYDPRDNSFFDCDGVHFGDIMRLVSPYRLQCLKEVGGYEYVTKNDTLYEIVFPFEDD